MIEPLKRAKKHLETNYCIIPPDWRYGLYGILLEYDRLIREQLNSWFLCECRRQRKIPNFIKFHTQQKMPNTDNQVKFNKLTLNYHIKLLNATIKESYRKVSRIKHNYDRKLNVYATKPDRSWSEAKTKREALNYIDVYIGQIEAVHLKDKKLKQQRKLSTITPYNKKQEENILDENGNLAQRITLLGDVELSREISTLLSKGPNFVVADTSKQALKKKINGAEVGFERFAYGVRWLRVIEEENELHSNTGLRINNPETVKKQPPPLKTQLEEQTLKETKAQIIAEYKNTLLTAPPTKNITQKEIDALRDLQLRDDLIVKQSDKDKQFVVAPKTMYIEHVGAMLKDETTYTRVKKNPLNSMINEVESVCEHMSTKYPVISKQSKPYLPRLPEFYCCYKTHKQTTPPPMRPVTSQVDSPAERLGEVVNYVLQQTLEYVPVHLSDSAGLREYIRGRNITASLTSRHIIATADVKSLYTNVPVEHGMQVVAKFVKTHMETIDMLGIDFDDFCIIMKTVLDAGYFRFNDCFYKQIDGLGMGVKPAPPFAIIYVYCTVEKPLLEFDYEYIIGAVPKRPDNLVLVQYWARYVDDCLILAEATTEEMEQLFDYINKLNPHIQFTYEMSTYSIDFLDLTIHLDQTTHRLEHELFIKPTSLGIFLNYQSAHPQSTITNCAVNEIERALKNGTTDQYKKNGVQKISQMLRKNNYPADTIRTLIRRAEGKQAENRDKYKKHMKYVLCLPFIGEQHKRKILAILRKSGMLENTRVCFNTDKNLKEILTRSALLPTPCNKQSDKKCYQCDEHCMTKNLAYLLTCTLCQQKYAGETGRCKRTRCWEHYKSVAKENDKTAMGKHYLAHHADEDTPLTPFKFEILKVCRDYTERMLWQSLYIKELSPEINKQLSNDTDSWTKNTWSIM